MLLHGLELLPPLHQAAWRGELADVNRLVAEDGRRLNLKAQVDDEDAWVEMNKEEAWSIGGCTPLMLAACNGHEAVVGRLIELGADVGLQDIHGSVVVHWACFFDQTSVLALLLDTGASLNARDAVGATPLMVAASWNAVDCVALLIARGADALELDVQYPSDGATALNYAAYQNQSAIVQLLLHAGADPTIRDDNGRTPLDVAIADENATCIPLLQVALAEPQRPRCLLKARALLDAAHKIRIMQSSSYEDDDEEQGQPRHRMRTRSAPKRRAVVAAPAYLKRRVEQGQEPPRVTVNDDQQQSEELVACLKYALGLAYGGGVHFEGEKPVGMLREVFVDLCELLVPKWDRKNV